MLCSNLHSIARPIPIYITYTILYFEIPKHNRPYNNNLADDIAGMTCLILFFYIRLIAILIPYFKCRSIGFNDEI